MWKRFEAIDDGGNKQSLKASAADPMIFIDKPISAGLLAVGALVMLFPLSKWLWRIHRREMDRVVRSAMPLTTAFS